MADRFVKDPDAVLDYQVNWSTWLDGDTIADAEWEAETGITIDSQSFTTTAATVWLSGGTASVDYNVTSRITTAAGRIDDRTIVIVVAEK